jgi:membrane-bound serine protease (ClpP class)
MPGFDPAHVTSRARMLLVGAIVLAVFVLPPGWGIALVTAAGVVEIGETVLWIKLSRRRRIQMGPETLIGASGTAVDPCRPNGRVRVQEELWQARCAAGADAGERVRVVAREGLVLVVEPDRDVATA